MINASGEFQRIIMNERRNFAYDLDIEFLNGTKKKIDDTMLITDGNSITVSAGTSSLPLGNAVSRILRLTLSNLHEEWSEYNFLGATISVTLSLELSDGTIERIYLGKYTVVEPESYGTTIGVNALDNLYRADKKFNWIWGDTRVSAQQVFIETCAQSGLSYVSADFPNNDYMMGAPESDITCRKVLGQCALLAGGNALCDHYGRVFIREYQFDEQQILDGGIFDSGTPSYITGASVDGGTFAYDDGDDVDGGTFADLNKYHIFSNVYTTAIGTDDVVVTKVKATRDEEVYEYGSSDAYVIQIATDMYPDLTDVCTRIGIILVETSFRPFDISHSCYPLAEMGDYCLITDRKGNTYHSIITDVEFNFRGATQISCKSDSPMRNSSMYLTQETQAIAQTQKLLAQERTERESAIQAMAEEIANANGMYIHDIPQEDGSFIRYIHNKPELADSAIQWKMTVDNISVSTDYGKTFTWAIDVSGTAILDRLVAGSISADKIGGSVYTVGGAEHASDGKIEVKNASNQVLVRLDSSGIWVAPSVKISASNISGGTFNGNSIVLGGQNNTSGTLKAYDSTGTKVLFGIDNTGLTLDNFTIPWGKVTDHDGVVEGTPNWLYNDVSQAIQASNFTVTGGGIDMPSEYGYVRIYSLSHGTSSFYAELDNDSLGLYGSGNTYTELTRSSLTVSAELSGGGTSQSYISASQITTKGSKPRLISTKQNGDILFYCYELPSPMFGDIGTGKLDETGVCEIYLDEIVYESIDNKSEYQVFLQAYGDGKCYIDKIEPNKFIVKGTPNMKFAWELKALQFDANGMRNDRFEKPKDRELTSIDSTMQDLLIGVYGTERM